MDSFTATEKDLLGFVEPCILISEDKSSFPSFPDLYQLSGWVQWTVDDQLYAIQGNWIFGPKEGPQKCAICSHTPASGAKFDSVSHLIPENLGNKRVVSLEECDDCNNRLSICDQELGELLKRDALFAGVITKSGGGIEIDNGQIKLIGKGVGKPIEIHIDPSQSPLGKGTSNSFDIPNVPVKAKEASAIRAIAKSAWLLMADDIRKSNTELLDFIEGKINFPFFYKNFYTPGVQMSAGRLRVWTLRQASPDWSPIVFTLTLGCTTIAWQMKNRNGVEKGPLPPIPVHDKQGGYELDEFQVNDDSIQLRIKTLPISFSGKVPGPNIPPPPKRKSEEIIKELKKSKKAQIAVAPDSGSVNEWLTGLTQVKRLSGNLERLEETIINLRDYGLVLTLKQNDGPQGWHFDFRPEKILISKAIKGAYLAKKLATATQGENLFIQDEGGIKAIPVGTVPSPDLDLKNIEDVYERIRSFYECCEALNIDPILKSITEDYMARVYLIGAARGFVRLPFEAENEIDMSAVEFAKVKTKTVRTDLIFSHKIDGSKLNGIDEATLGNVTTQITILNPSTDIIVTSDGDIVRFKIPRAMICLVFPNAPLGSNNSPKSK